MDFVVTREVIATLIEQARLAGDAECCGLLLGVPGRIDQAVPTANIHAQPERQFEIDPVALIAAYRAQRAGGPALLGFYHSHPHGHPRPSATDCEHAGGDGRVWAIVAAGEVQLWHDTPRGFVAAAFMVVAA